jgi:outer membrane protein assembly factor BamB
MLKPMMSRRWFPVTTINAEIAKHAEQHKISASLAVSASIVVAVLAVALFTTPGTMHGAPGDWTQWGGPTRNFIAETTGLASSWPSGGPKKLWTRALGEGHSSILVENGRLYTQYRPLGLVALVRRSQEEVVTALDAATGKAVWEFKYAAPTSDLDFSQGAGPHSTPLVVGNRLYATSTRKELFALDKTNGRLLWSHALMKEYGAPPPGRGYSCSPLSYRDTVIVTVGGRGQAVAAFNAQSGALVWKNGTFETSPASPILIDVDGQPQIVVFGGDQVVGMDPGTGRTLWAHPHRTDWGLNISTPSWSASDHLLFISSAYSTGSRALELRQAAGKTSVTEKWASNRVRIHFGSVIRLGDYMYGSSGDFGPAFLTAVELKTGRTAWQDRSFARAQLLYGDGKLILLDEDGALGLATISPQGFKVLARASVLENLSWTAPTLVGTKLYARDRKNIVAFELGS